MRNMYYMHFLSVFIFVWSIIYSLGSITWLGCWFGMEIGNLMLYIWFNVNDLNRNIISGSLYFWISGISGFGLLGVYFIYDSFMIMSFFGFVFFFCLKMGMFPFYGWVIMLFKRLDYFIFFMLSSVVKIPLLMLLDYFFNVGFYGVFLMLFLFSYISFFVGVGGLSQMSFKGIMGYSSVNVASDFFISYMLSYDLFMFVMFNYIVILVGLFFIVGGVVGDLSVFGGVGLKGFIDNNKSYEVLFLALFGMPMFFSFYLKFWSGLFFLGQGFSYLNVLVFIFFMVIACLNYYRCWLYFNYNNLINYMGGVVSLVKGGGKKHMLNMFVYMLFCFILVGCYMVFMFFVFY